jgi:hypothetical protein
VRRLVPKWAAEQGEGRLARHADELCGGMGAGPRSRATSFSRLAPTIRPSRKVTRGLEMLTCVW